MRLDTVRGPGAESCPGDDTLRAVLIGELQDDPFQANAPSRLVVTLSGAPRKGHVQARAEIRNAAGRVIWDRDLGRDDCQIVLSAVGFALAMALEPRPKPPIASSPRSSPALVADRPARQSPRDRASAPSRPQQAWGPWAVTLGTQLVYGAVPDGFAGTVDASVGYRLPLGYGLLGAVSLEAQWQAPAAIDLGSALMRLSRASGGLSSCVHWEILYGCGVFHAGAWIGEVETEISGSGFDLYTAFAGRLGLEVPVYNRFSLQFHGELGSILHHPALALNDQPRWVGVPLSGALGLRALALF